VDSCGSGELGLTVNTPNLMFMVDRTKVMDEVLPSGDPENKDAPKSRFAATADAVVNLVDQNGPAISGGLGLFPGCAQQWGNFCEIGQVVQPIGSSAAQLSSGFEVPFLCGGIGITMGNTLATLIGDASLQQEGRDNAVVLITTPAAVSGVCQGSNAQQTAKQLLAQSTPVKTHVVVIGKTTASSGATGYFKWIAKSGGTGTFHEVTTVVELNTALADIAAESGTCDFTLQSKPKDTMQVFFDNDPTPIANDGLNGWTYDDGSNTISFHGTVCEQIQAGNVDIDVVDDGCTEPNSSD